MSDRSLTVLFAMWEGGGTIPPELGVARRLVAGGHGVHILGDPTIEGPARRAGCDFSPWRRAPHRTSFEPDEDLIKDWEVRNPLSLLKRARDRFMAGPAAEYAADTASAIDRVEPDVALVDALMLGPILGAQARRVPVGAVLPSAWMFPAPGVPAFGPGFQPARGPLGRLRDRVVSGIGTRVLDVRLPTLNQVRADFGLEPLASMWDQVLTADRILVLTSAAFDYASAHVPDHARYLGPILDDPEWAESWTPPWDADDDRPLVLVGFSSTYQDQAGVLGRVVEALAALPVRAVVTLGQMLAPGTVTPAPNVVVTESAPHGPILERADLVVTHCGHGTTMKSLAAGVPLVCVPMGRDQNDVAARVVHHGAGVRVSPGAPAAKIADAVSRVLADPGYRDAAGRLAAAIAHDVSQGDVCAEVEALAGLAGRTAAHSRLSA